MKVLDISEHYQIYEDGRVWSKKQNKFLKPRYDSKGYVCYSLKIGGKLKNYFAHRLVAQYFIPHPLGKDHVNHIDGNKTNNTALNLEWVTHQENMLHARQNKLMRTSKPRPIEAERKRSGANNPNAKLQEDDVLEIRGLQRTRVPLEDIADKYGVKPSTIKNIWQRHTWRHI